ncbi:MAG: nucleotidyltransferase family protein [bacterium]|nr:nucleotidyltransferase family protein [bacterium]
MKAFLLAAGLGRRLGELTRHTPKCLLPIGGRPLLDYWFDALEAARVEEVLVNLHHHAEMVQAYLDTKVTPIRIRTLREPELLGSAGTIRTAWDFVADERDFFIVYADNFARVDLSRLARFHGEHGDSVLTLVAYPTDEPQRCGVVELDERQRVVSFEEKPQHPRSHLANAGLHVASRGLYEYLPEKIPADLGFDVLPKLIGKMAGYVTDEYIQDIGTPETYARAQRAANVNC